MTKYFKMCEKKFERKGNLHSTSFHQMMVVTCYVSVKSKEIIGNLGFPISVIGKKDEDNFVRNLSDYQR